MGILKKVLPPENRSIDEVSKESGVSRQTIYNWVKASICGKLDAICDEKSPRSYTLKEKYHILMESAKIPEEEMGVYLRERGLHSEHLTMWDQELREMAHKKEDKQRQELAALRKKVKQQEKELARKDKALAEAAALLVLKKNLNSLLEENEED